MLGEHPPNTPLSKNSGFAHHFQPFLPTSCTTRAGIKYVAVAIHCNSYNISLQYQILQYNILQNRICNCIILKIVFATTIYCKSIFATAIYCKSTAIYCKLTAIYCKLAAIYIWTYTYFYMVLKHKSIYIICVNINFFK